MGKNKRWKRKAKRIKGYCTTSFNVKGRCSYCEYYINGYCDCIVANADYTPNWLGIREIERICKYGR